MADWMGEQGIQGVATAVFGDNEHVIVGDGVLGVVSFLRAKASGRPGVQRAFSLADGRRCLMFAHEKHGFSNAAIEWAKSHDVALFVYNDNGAMVGAATIAAEKIRAAGQFWRS